MILRRDRRRLHQLCLRPRIASELHDALDGFRRGFEVGDVGLGEKRPHFLHRAFRKPCRDHRLFVAKAPLLLDGLDRCFRRIDRRGKRRRTVYDEHHIRIRILHDGFHRRRVTVRPSVADNVDRVAMRPCWGKHLVQGVDRLRLKVGERPSQVGKRVGGNDARTASVRHDGDAASGNAPNTRKHFRRIEHLIQIDNAQDSGAAQRGGVDVIGTCERPRMRGRGLRPFRVPAGLDRDHGLRARAPPRRGHELGRVLDGLEIKEHGPVCDIACEIVEHVAQVDVGGISDRDHMAEADTFDSGPIEHRRA